MADVPVGKISHYFNKIGVAVVDVSAPISVGDQIKIVGHENEFTQTVSSIQEEHKQIEKAKKGQAIGMKVDQPVKDGDQVFKVE